MAFKTTAKFKSDQKFVFRCNPCYRAYNTCIVYPCYGAYMHDLSMLQGLRVCCIHVTGPTSMLYPCYRTYLHASSMLHGSIHVAGPTCGLYPCYRVYTRMLYPCYRAYMRYLSMLQGTLVRWLKVNFSEAFTAWIHVKALRVFVESVLRWGSTFNPTFNPSPQTPTQGLSKYK